MRRKPDKDGITESWRWPEKPQNATPLSKKILGLPKIYQGDVVPMCYPGTSLSMGMIGNAQKLIAQQLNLIGSHTRIELNEGGEFVFPDGEGGFEEVQKLEARALFMIASMIGGTPKTVDGYFCGGGTEANYEGLWIGRQWLRRCPDPYNKGVAVLVSPIRHYSIDRAANILDLGEGQVLHCSACDLAHLYMPDASGAGVNLVGMNGAGEMSMDCLQQVFERKYAEGFRRFIFAPTVGTTMMGSIDPVKEMAVFIREQTRKTGANFYMHVDASFAGFTVPFVNQKLDFAFEIPEVSSVTLDADKMGHLPYPAGVFLCRKGLMALVAQKVEYVGGNRADTFSGSRSALAPVLAWYAYKTKGVVGQRKYVQKCLDLRNKMLGMVKERHPWIRLLPASPWVNFAPMEIPMDPESGKIPPLFCGRLGTKDERVEANEALKKMGYDHIPLAGFQLRSDYFPSDPSDVHSCPRHVYKICIMPHHTEKHVVRFLEELEKARIAWERYKGWIE